MSYGRRHAFSTLAVFTALAFSASAQSVISTHSGVIHFFEGAVSLSGQPLEPHLGKFPCMTEGSELRTAEGRAEVLLTPGVFLRLGEKSAIRMVSNDLADTRVEMLGGSAILDSSEAGADTSVTLVYKNWKMRFPQKGVYRFDSEPARLWAQKGQAEVAATGSATPVSVEAGMFLPFDTVLVPEPAVGTPTDTLADWAHGRSDSISADNAITAQIDEDPSTNNSPLGLDGVTYFPLIGASSMALALSPYGAYGSVPPYQLGFNSLYLPGFVYRPLILGLSPSGIRTYLNPTRIGAYPTRIGGSTGIGINTPITRYPVLRPMPAPSHPILIPRGAVHVGGHR